MAKQDYSYTSYVFSVIGLVLAFFQPLAGLILSIVALKQSKKQKSELTMKARKYSTIGIVVSAIMIIISVAYGLLSSAGYLSSVGY